MPAPKKPGKAESYFTGNSWLEMGQARAIFTLKIKQSLKEKIKLGGLLLLVHTCFIKRVYLNTVVSIYVNEHSVDADEPPLEYN